MEKRKAIVVGATSGIGREVAIQLAATGWDVAVAGRRTERLQELVDSVDGIVAYEHLDVNADDAPAALERLIEKLGDMDLYFHSSGIGWQNVELDAERELATTMTNGVGFVRMVTAAFNWMAKNGKRGHIACITSIAGTKGLGAAPAYSATKRFQNHYLGCLMQQSRMRRLGIHFTDIRPGFVATDLIAGSNFPFQLRADRVAVRIVRAIHQRRRVVVVDWRYAILVALWRLIPSWLWVRLPIHS